MSVYFQVKNKLLQKRAHGGILVVLDPSHCGGMTEAVRVLTPSAGHSLTLKKRKASEGKWLFISS